MKRLFTLWVVLFVVLSAMAVPAKPGVWRTISLTDGTQVKVQLVGDELKFSILVAKVQKSSYEWYKERDFL